MSGRSRRSRVPGTRRRTVRALVLVPDPTQPGLTPAERLALTLRAEATATGRCACGATRPPIRARRGEYVEVAIVHRHDCPAADGPHIDRLVARLGGEGSVLYAAVVVDVEVAA
jgi:hypothetical protein